MGEELQLEHRAGLYAHQPHLCHAGVLQPQHEGPALQHAHQLHHGFHQLPGQRGATEQQGRGTGAEHAELRLQRLQLDHYPQLEPQPEQNRLAQRRTGTVHRRHLVHPQSRTALPHILRQGICRRRPADGKSPMWKNKPSVRAYPSRVRVSVFFVREVV